MGPCQKQRGFEQRQPLLMRQTSFGKVLDRLVEQDGKAGMMICCAEIIATHANL